MSSALLPRTDIAAPSGSLHRLPRRHDLDLRRRTAPVRGDDGDGDRRGHVLGVVAADLLDAGIVCRETLMLPLLPMAITCSGGSKPQPSMNSEMSAARRCWSCGVSRG